MWVSSDKEEYAAHTIRNKIHKNLEQWLVDPGEVRQHPHRFKSNLLSASWDDVQRVVDNIPDCGIKLQFQSGEIQANKHLQHFIKDRLSSYAADRNKPDIDGQSDMSPYLHFGQISALRVALDLVNESEAQPLLFREEKLASCDGKPTTDDSINTLIEELVVRKELADNYCFYNKNYDNLKGAKPWAVETLSDHKNDSRDFVYGRDERERAAIHDLAWNAAQQQMMQTGKMHGYMRMYWDKKILEWSVSPDEAISTAIYLNDKYSIDGDDPNGYTGIMWSIAGVHDRPWFERDVFGKIRYMNAGGLKRKFNLESYIMQWVK